MIEIGLALQPLARGLRQLRRFMLLAATMLLTALLTATSARADVLDLSAYRGKVVYVDYWASWCGPCMQSFPWMKKMQETYGKDGFVIVAVNADSQREPADDFLRKASPNFTIAYDPDGQLFQTYHLKGVPTAILFDRNGQQRTRHVGWHADQTDSYEATIRALVQEK